MKKNNKGTALVAPLDWGLGHTTRCIPVIKLLQQNGYKVIVAGEKRQVQLLQQEFPDLFALDLPGYRIRYTQYKRLLPLKILWQLPKILRAINQEHKWLKKTIVAHNIQLVVSDNRFGLWSSGCTCVFMTHQLAIQMPFNWLGRITQRLNYQFINRYAACWVPDMASAGVNLAGALSHPSLLPRIPVRYIGPLSRIQPVNANNNEPYKYKWLFVLSGPEPQRSLLEQKLLAAAAILQEPALLLRALPGDTALPNAPSNCTVENHLPGNAMAQAFADSEFVVSRSGYTTVMELLTLKKKSVLIPTPGQTEQEYLAGHLLRQQWCYSCDQDDDITLHLKKVNRFAYIEPEDFKSNLQEALDQLNMPELNTHGQ
ncbi:UDP-N-acetylglucosamine--N-acetylmuramyl-(pentapeptide) pyrophosphoryl-undecaprenol N-acetylglucosamine transferase [Filimonas effusa]|nr:UDP-N-acetylglucosamine--N-acetylmuramyl-(pentapeptide) pyrophosphoryl-undecaprenol N-acetylglucosamine transferase [Filimonas effusa]